jgi:hypothetical protein
VKKKSGEELRRSEKRSGGRSRPGEMRMELQRRVVIKSVGRGPRRNTAALLGLMWKMTTPRTHIVQRRREGQVGERRKISEYAKNPVAGMINF